MGIMLQSSVGPFDESFLIRIPQIERMMQAQGLDPSQFVIAKDRSPSSPLRPFGTRLWDYTVFVDGRPLHRHQAERRELSRLFRHALPAARRRCAPGRAVHRSAVARAALDDAADVSHPQCGSAGALVANCSSWGVDGSEP